MVLRNDTLGFNNNWYVPQVIYDTVSTNPWNCMNLHMNQLAEHSRAWPGMLQVPNYSFNDYLPYGNNFSNNYLTAPGYTLAQSAWGTPAWNNGFSAMWNNGNPWNNGNAWGNIGGGNNGNGGGNSDSAENKKYNRLLNLLKQIVQYDDIDEADKDKLNDAIRNAKGTTEEKYEQLQEAYKEFKNTYNMENILIENAHKMNLSDNSNDNLHKKLASAGFEYEGEAIDDNLSEFYDSVRNASDSDGNISKASDLISKIKDKEYDILDVVSSWNSNYKNSSTSNRIIGHLKEQFSKINDKDQRGQIVNAMEDLSSELISKAQKVKSGLDSDSVKKIEDAITKLEKAKDDTTVDSVSGDLSKAFDDLYLLTRLGAMTKLRKDIKARYGDIDSDVFNDKLFAGKVKEDLNEEGFDNNTIASAGVKLGGSKVKKSEEGEEKVDNDDEGNPPEDKQDKNSDKVSAKSKGASVRHMLYQGQWGGTISDDMARKVASHLDEVSNSDDIFLFLDGYYNDKKQPNEGILERLDDDTNNDIVTTTKKRRFVKAVLDKAKELGLSDNDHYEKLTTILYNETDDEMRNLDGTCDFGAFWTGDTYGEAMDKELYELYKLMKEKTEKK